MSAETLIAFAAASFLLIVVPGPVVTLLISRSAAFGPRAGLTTLAGTMMAISGQLAVVTLGLGAALVIVGEWFTWLKWIGAAYLIWLGGRALLAAWRGDMPEETTRISHHRFFWEGLVIGGTNPKSLLFFGAFFPQFLDPSVPVTPQLAILSVIFLVIAVLSDGAYTLAAGRIGRRLESVRARRWREGLSGGVLVAAGIVLALARRPQAAA